MVSITIYFKFKLADDFKIYNYIAMGCDYSSAIHEKVESPTKIDFKTNRPSITSRNEPKDQYSEKSLKFLRQISFISQIQEYVSLFAYTDDDLLQIAKQVINCLVDFSELEKNDDLMEINQIVEENASALKEFKIFYEDLLPQLEKRIPHEQIFRKSMANSCCYNKIANIIHDQKLPLQKLEEVHLKKFYKRVKYPYFTNYSKLTPKQLDQLVQLETCESIMEHFGKKFEFKYLIMKDQSQKIMNMLIDCFQKYSTDIAHFKYDASQEESLFAADISRRACQYYDQGIYILLEYFVRCCQNLEKTGSTVQQIENKLKQALDKIKDKYPPGSTLDKSVNEQQALKKLQVNHDPLIHYEKIGGNKDKQLEEIIWKKAQVAKQHREQFQQLIQGTCLQRCISFKTGLKLNPNAYGEVSQLKAIIRIKQKMLLKKKKAEEKVNGSTVQEVLENEQKNYTNVIKNQLESLDTINFQVDDMLRGKCTFISLSDIIETVTDIKHYISQNPDEKLRIVQVEDRFSRQTPISDVTLKLAHGDRISSQLQLSLQTNKAAYDFAHKIYEFNRTKVFSKIKIINNYYEEYSKQMKQMISKALELAEKSPESGLYVHSDSIRQFFRIKSQKPKTFEDVLIEEFRKKQNQIKNKNKLIALSTFSNTVFLRKMGLHKTDLAEKVRHFLRDPENSKIVKGMILFQLFVDIQMTDLSVYLNWYSYLQYIAEEFNLLFHEEFSKGIILPSKVMIKILELIHLFKLSRGGEISDCYQHLSRLYGKLSWEYALFQIKEGKIKDYCKQYEAANKIFISALQKLQDIFSNTQSKLYIQKISSMMDSVQLFVAQSELKLRRVDNADKIINTITNKFRQKEPSVELMLCELLNAECILYKNMDSFSEAYQKVVKKAMSLGLVLRGRNVAESYYRIGQYLLNEAKIQQALQIYYKKAFEEFGSYMIGRELYEKMCNIWPKYSLFNFEQPVLKPNGQMKQLSLQNSEIDADKCYYLSKVNWPNLVQLNLWDNDVGPLGCHYLSMAKWPKLKKLNLYSNQIYAQGCLKLSESNWPELSHLVLGKNGIDAEGCRFLKTAKWPALNQLYLYKNQIGDEGCKELADSQWPFLSMLSLTENRISAKGCQYLSQAKWPNLIELKLWINKYLSQAKWQNLAKLNLWDNHIEEQGYLELSQALWPNLRVLNLTKNAEVSENALIKLHQAFGQTSIVK